MRETLRSMLNGGRDSVDKLEKYRNIVKQIINEYAKLKPAYGEIKVETVFDEDKDRYIMTNVGWENGKRIYGNIIQGILFTSI